MRCSICAQEGHNARTCPLKDKQILRDHALWMKIDNIIILYSEGGEADVQNMITLCPECHRDYHSGKIKLDIFRF